MVRLESALQWSDVKPDQQHVAVLHDVLLALQAHLARGLALGPAAGRGEVVVGDRLGADEAARQIAMDRAGGLLSRAAPAQRPAAGLLLAGGEERDQPQRRERGADEA